MSLGSMHDVQLENSRWFLWCMARPALFIRQYRKICCTSVSGGFSFSVLIGGCHQEQAFKVTYGIDVLQLSLLREKINAYVRLRSWQLCLPIAITSMLQ